MKTFMLTDDSGQGMVEYTLILGLIILTCLTALWSLSSTIQGKGDEIVENISVICQ